MHISRELILPNTRLTDCALIQTAMSAQTGDFLRTHTLFFLALNGLARVELNFNEVRFIS